METKLYNVDQISKILQINPQTTLRFIREGKIKAIKVGREYRVKESDLNEYLGLYTPAPIPAIDIPVEQKV